MSRLKITSGVPVIAACAVAILLYGVGEPTPRATKPANGILYGQLFREDYPASGSVELYVTGSTHDVLRYVFFTTADGRFSVRVPSGKYEVAAGTTECDRIVSVTISKTTPRLLLNCPLPGDHLKLTHYQHFGEQVPTGVIGPGRMVAGWRERRAPLHLPDASEQHRELSGPATPVDSNSEYALSRTSPLRRSAIGAPVPPERRTADASVRYQRGR